MIKARHRSHKPNQTQKASFTYVCTGTYYNLLVSHLFMLNDLHREMPGHCKVCTISPVSLCVGLAVAYQISTTT